MNISRITRNILITFMLIGISAGAAWAAEDLFLSDSRPGWGSSDIYRVNLDPVNRHGNLTLIRTVPLDECYALACTPDGERCYAIAKHTADFGYLDLGDNGWYPLPTVVDADGFIVPEIVLAAFSPEGELFVASQLNDKFYFVDTVSGMATEVGYAEEDIARGTIVDIAGADMAFKPDGHFCMWTNATQTMYTLTLPDTFPGIVIATKEFDQVDTFVTGLAFRANGYGGPIGSETDVNPNSFLVTDGDPFLMYLGGQPFAANWGDMANGSLELDICTLTIGYYKNHSWDGAVVDVCGVALDETSGGEILWNAKGNNFSMLFAQLIAAKLNVGEIGGFALIDDTEDWLCQQANAVGDGELFWDAKFEDKTQKGLANSYMIPLDEFNNSNHCD